MYTEITFNPIIKYLVIFLLSYMFLNNLSINHTQILFIVCFIMILSITVDIFEFGEYGTLLKFEQDHDDIL